MAYRDASIARAIAIADAREAEQAEHAGHVRTARDIRRHVDDDQEVTEPSSLSGGLNPAGIGNDRSEYAERHRAMSGASTRGTR
ncbi:hypothetical protein [Polymorphospora sp. NPDC050346]|uniref:hypothetical protein n=1 Tax=Polymorphospora sp. NPDC050346 TaxID=3155780 RepID=UPI0033E0D734